MRWRLAGAVAYTDGIVRGWAVPPSLRQLLVQVDEAYPLRHGADGTVAGQGHYLNSPKSDHTPDKNGWVRAGDIGEVTENDAFDVAEAVRLSQDPRIKYVIHESRIYSSYNHPNGLPFTWRSYYGSNRHLQHVHFSLLRINQHSLLSWNIGSGGGEENMAAVQVIDVQRALNTAGRTDFEDKSLDEDDDWGPRTASALVKAYSADGGPAGVTSAQVASMIRGTNLVP